MTLNANFIGLTLLFAGVIGSTFGFNEYKSMALGGVGHLWLIAAYIKGN